MAKLFHFIRNFRLPLAVLALGLATPALSIDVVSSNPLARPPALMFDWYANGAQNASIERARAALVAVQVIDGPGRWICSPAGFGHRSRCYSG